MDPLPLIAVFLMAMGVLGALITIIRVIIPPDDDPYNF